MKISIIVPVYLSEPFLDKNYNNLINQTYNDLEIIYVNDGSPDSSGTKCDEFSGNDSRIKVIHQQNNGAAGALNEGVKNATGDYIMFLDADDWIDLNTCELALETAIKHDVDMVFWPNIKEYDGKSVLVPSFFAKSKEFSGIEMSFLRRRMIGLLGEELKSPMQTDAFNAGWGKLYRLNVIKDNDVQWTDTKYVGSSDVLFNAQQMPFIQSAYYLDKHLHHYNKNNNNSLTRTYNNTLQEKFGNLFLELEKVIQHNYSKSENHDLFVEAMNNRVALSTVNIGLGFVAKGITLQGYQMFKNLVKKEIYQKSFKNFQIQYLPIHYRLFFLCCKYRIYPLAYLLMYIMRKLRK